MLIYYDLVQDAAEAEAQVERLRFKLTAALIEFGLFHLSAIVEAHGSLTLILGREYKLNSPIPGGTDYEIKLSCLDWHFGKLVQYDANPKKQYTISDMQIQLQEVACAIARDREVHQEILANKYKSGGVS